jgi:hypothetical protein
MRRSIGVAFLVAWVTCATLWAQTGSVAGTVIAQRESDDDRTVLVSVPTSIDGRSVDTVRVAVGRKVARKASAETLPDGWTMAVDRGWLVFSGPPATEGDAIAISAAVDRPLEPGYIEVVMQSGGLTIAEGAVQLENWATMWPPLDPNEVVAFPPVVSAESLMTFGLDDPDLQLPPGHWLVGDRVAKMLEPGTFEVTLGYPMQPGVDIPISYTDSWGRTLVDGVLAGVQLVPDASPDEPPRITGCSPKVLTGGILCVCGYFPTAASREYLTINGQPLGKPVTSSKWILTFRLPEIPPGEFIVEGPLDAGFGAGSSAKGLHIAVRGEIDRETLMRGQSTPLTLWIDGTDEPMSLRLWNTTSNIVSLDGGEDQVVTTDGGSPNQVQRTVHAVSPGDFIIKFELSGHWCPCAETIAEEAVATLTGASGLAEVDDRVVSEACTQAEADCERFRLLAQTASRAASEARAEAYRLEANQRWVDDEADWVFENSDRTRVYLATLQQQAQGWRELADKARALAKKNWERDATYPGTGWDYWARQAEQDAERRDAHADELEREIVRLCGDTARQEDRVQELQEAIERARAEAAKAQAEADKAWAAYQACLAALPSECPSPITGSLLYAGSVTIFDDDGEPHDVDPFDPKAAICGPDVTEHVLELLDRIIDDFDNAKPAAKAEACNNIVDPTPDQNLVLIGNYAWDIGPLSPGRAPTKHDKPDPKENSFWFEGISPICAQPRRYPCGPTVEFLGECVHSQVLNYIQWGLMNELCDQPMLGDFWHFSRAYGTLSPAHYDAQVTISDLGATYVRARRRHDADPDFRNNPASWPPEKVRELRRELLRQVLKEKTQGDEDWQSRQAKLCAPICRLTPLLERSLAMETWDYIWYGITEESPARLIAPAGEQGVPKIRKP